MGGLAILDSEMVPKLHTFLFVLTLSSSTLLIRSKLRWEEVWYLIIDTELFILSFF